jgi:hypothetical protein
MINPASLPSWDLIFSRCGLKPLRRGRGACPFCDSSTGFSCHDEKGFNCFACGVHGGKISFIRQFRECDFKGALRFFGLEPGLPPVPDPVVEREKRIRNGLHRWSHTAEHRLRDEYYMRSQAEVVGKALLAVDPEDPEGWEMLRIAYTGRPLEEIEIMLDLLIGKEGQQLEAYKMMRPAA